MFRPATIVLALLIAACARPAGEAPSNPAFLNQAPGVPYVGIAACVGCHKDKAETFSHTGMGRAAFPMTEEVANEDFSTNNEISIEHQGGVRYRMTARDGRYFMRQFVLDGNGRETDADERAMEWVIGSGNHSRSYATRVNGKLFQMPVCWYPETRVWDLCPGFEGKNDRFTREITESCIFCHNARMELVPGTRNLYREPIPSGIDCERCHGPGGLHVEKWRGGTDEPTGGLDPTIVNPERLPPELRIEVCYQCHLGDSKATERVQRPGRSLADYRPGTPLVETFVPFWLADADRTAFGISAQADRFLRSRCRTESGGRLECLTCHDPHVPVYRRERSAERFREKCLGCHEPGACTAPEEARRATPALSDDCVQCHMRKGEPDDHPHTTFTDHWIRSPRAGEAPSGRVADLVPIFPQTHDRLPGPEREFLRGRAYLLKSLDFPDEVRKAMWRTAEDAFRGSIRAEFAVADSWFFLGKILGYERRAEEAADAFRRAADRDPGHHDAMLALATTLANRGRIADADAVLGRLLARWPEDPGALAEMARCEMARNRPDQALAYIGRAVAAEPWTASLHLNRAVILAASGRAQEAGEACREARKLDPMDARLRSICESP